MQKLTRFTKNAEQCGICLNTISFQGKLDICSHAFCFDCILRWSDVSIN